MAKPDIKLACIAAAVLLPAAAHASFGGTPCRAEFGCHFVFWGLLLGVTVGIPVSAAIFGVLHFVFCHPDRSKLRQVLLGGAIGAVVFEIAAACAAQMASWDKNPWLGLIGAFVALAALSVLYARSPPRHPATSTAEAGDVDTGTADRGR